MEKKTNNQIAHEAVLTLLFDGILNSEKANELHMKIDKKIKD